MQQAAKINNPGNLEPRWPRSEKLRPPDKRNNPRKFGTGPEGTGTGRPFASLRGQLPVPSGPIPNFLGLFILSGRGQNLGYLCNKSYLRWPGHGAKNVAERRQLNSIVNRTAWCWYTIHHKLKSMVYCTSNIMHRTWKLNSRVHGTSSIIN